MNLSKFNRRFYSSGPTPIEKLDRLSSVLGGPDIYIKRDDLLGVAGGGNKIRKLEFLMADALKQGADTIITCGAPQSNHCRLTLAVSNKENMPCYLVLRGNYDKTAGGNNLLFNILGAEGIIHVSNDSDLNIEMEKLADDLRSKGRKPYVIPLGGTNEIGMLGYISCAREILQQTFEMSVEIEHMVCTSGSGGTHGGLLTGFKTANAEIPVTGISVYHKADPQTSAIHDHCQKAADFLGIHNEVAMDDIIVFDDYVGGGYAQVTKEMMEAVRLAAKTEAVILDPVYTGKTMAGLIDLVRKGYFNNTKSVLFLHTGGVPALYTYAKDFLND
ncbi:MAG: D-cysteine desulfhydrase [Defluviitaleaceae bacterium]|nr:D-cysteine desulfhydrase [Defluviitaleaceae bacterium]